MPAIQIVSALYGPPAARRPADFSERLAATCGAGATSCDVFCRSALTGLYKRGIFGGPRPVCQVVYRCGDGRTSTAESDQGEVLSLRCDYRPADSTGSRDR
jgi:hypothetical protein